MRRVCLKWFCHGAPMCPRAQMVWPQLRPLCWCVTWSVLARLSSSRMSLSPLLTPRPIPSLGAMPSWQPQPPPLLLLLLPTEIGRFAEPQRHSI